MAKKLSLTEKAKAELFVRTPANTVVDVFRFHGESVKKKTMTFGEFIEMERQPGVRYQAYQPGICTIPITEN